jgi:hypothetical protein
MQFRLNLSCKIVVLFFLLFFVSCFSQAFASGNDPLNLASEPDADVKAAIPSEAEKAMYTDLFMVTDLMKDAE